MSDTTSEPPRSASDIRWLLFALLTVVLALGTAAVCAFAMLYVGLATDTDGADNPTTARGWVSQLAGAVHVQSSTSGALAVMLVLAAVVAVVGAWRRAGAATTVGVICAVMLAATLLVTAGGAAGRTDRLADRALDALDVQVAQLPAPVPQLLPPPAPERPSVDDVAADIDRMLRLTLDAAVGVPRAGGREVEPSEIVHSAVACDESGTRVMVALEIATDDNATSVARMLSAWVAEGYNADRAVREDIRYREGALVEVVRIRDATSIDGTIHLALESACAMAP